MCALVVLTPTLSIVSLLFLTISLPGLARLGVLSLTQIRELTPLLSLGLLMASLSFLLRLLLVSWLGLL